MFKQCLVITILILFACNTSFLLNSEVDAIEPYFTLVCKYNSGGGLRGDYCNLLKQRLEIIGINLDVINLDWPAFVGELYTFHDYDIVYMELKGKSYDPDFTGVYDENGSLNLFGYRTDMDYNETLGTGINEWYINEGRKILPPISQERIEHYWTWEQYLMDEILPCLPTFAPKSYTGYWTNLQGYNVTDGLLKSWGKMSWVGSHIGQDNINEIVIQDAAWLNLNPFFLDDSSSSFICSALMDSLGVYDSDMKIWPHLATGWSHITDTQIRITLREGVKWQIDPDELFPNEFFDAKDVYFTFKIYDSIGAESFNPWLDHMEIIDNYTIDFYIDGDSSQSGNQISNQYLPSLKTLILPEHYLNQSSNENGLPDFSHPAWNTFSLNAFGTGLFKLTLFEENEETILTVNPDSWWLNTSITSDPNLDWENRFGDFSGNLDHLRIKILPDLDEAYNEFRAGKLDIMSIIDRNIRIKLIDDPDFEVQSETMSSFGFFGYNMRPVRPVIGNPNAAPGDATMTIGLAIRKAISYAADVEEMNNIVHAGDYRIIYHPIYIRLGIWCNPNIIKYTHDLAKAKEYMTFAGFNSLEKTASTKVSWFYSISGLLIIVEILIVRRKQK